MPSRRARAAMRRRAPRRAINNASSRATRRSSSSLHRRGAAHRRGRHAHASLKVRRKKVYERLATASRRSTREARRGARRSTRCVGAARAARRRARPRSARRRTPSCGPRTSGACCASRRARRTAVQDAGPARAVADQPPLRARSRPGKLADRVARRAGPRRLLHRLGHARRRGSLPHVRRRRATATSAARSAIVARDSAAAATSHVLGYCLGGTLATIHAAALPEHVASLLALAAPVDFDDGRLMATWTRTPTFDVGAIVEAFGNVPWQLMQASFMLRPTLAARRLRRACSIARGTTSSSRASSRSRRWGNDNVSFPGACYVATSRSSIAATRSSGHLHARRAARSSLENQCPTLALAFEHDNIVPLPRARAADRAHRRHRQAARLQRGGHVGAVVSRKAADRLWPVMSNFWAQRD